MPEITITINHDAGLHARPLAQFVKVARQYKADINVWNLTANKGPARGDSPLKLMLLTVQKGHQIRIEAQGDQADPAIVALRQLIEDNFGEGTSGDG
jgi:phosphotransferase system HPr (HPr) family protein